ncbi:30S ribosomal protein S17, chloroplastic [Tanacetum coccineum]
MRSLQGRVITTTNDKTVNVEVTRLAPHPKYKRRVRKKKKFQAHDPENQFQVGDIVQLEKCKPISKKKTFLAIPVPKRNVSKKEQEIGIPLESETNPDQAA